MTPAIRDNYEEIDFSVVSRQNIDGIASVMQLVPDYPTVTRLPASPAAVL